MSRALPGVTMLVALLGAAAPAGAQDALATAQTQYLAADYEAALSTLGPSGAAEPAESDRLRARCLIALGRQNEAAVAIERAVIAQPLYDSAAESPRVRAVYEAVRGRVVPARARALYEAGKSAFTLRAYGEAVATFEAALPLLEALALEGHREMEALRILANDFLLLGRQQLPGRVETPALLPSQSPPIEALLAPAPPADTDVLEPFPLRQDLPPWTYGLGGPEAAFHGAVDVQIDAEGRVVDVLLSESVHPLYDPQLLLAARRWQYEPARLNGRAVTSTKRVEVTLRTRP